MAGSPIDQFRLNKIFDIQLFGFDISINNSTIMMFIILGTLIAVLSFLVRKLDVKPQNNSQVVAEGFYNFIKGMILGNVQDASAMKFFPFIFTLFMFILFSNLLAVIPYTFTITSHISITLAIAIIAFLIVIIVGIKRKGVVGYFKGFVPEGIPVFLVPLIFLIEFATYLMRPFTLAIRLAANLIAGHTILKVVAGFVSLMGVFGIVPILFGSIIIGFEVFVACLQAYVFSMLTCIYLNEALALHH